MYPVLTGLRVVECASFIAAPSCALYLQQMGAQVIRIDPPGGGPDFHRWPRKAGTQSSFYWEGLNKGKLSVAIDLSCPQGKQLATDLITAPGADAGILVTNFPPTGFLSHERLSALRTDLITLRVLGWSDGETAVDYTINPAVGIPGMTGPTDNGDRPVNHVLPAWDLLAGAYSAFALLAAERHRQRFGQGREICVPLSDIAISTMGNLGQIAETLFNGDRPRMGNDLFGAFGRDFTTADGKRVMIVAITPRQWAGLLKALDIEGHVAALEDTLGVSFARDEGLRFEHRHRLFPIVEAAVSSCSVPTLRERFKDSAVCWSEYQTLAQALNSEPRFSGDRALFNTIMHPSGAAYPAPGAAAGFGGMARDYVVAAPRLGQHTHDVLSETLRMSPPDIRRLHEDGIIHCAPPA